MGFDAFFGHVAEQMTLSLHGMLGGTVYAVTGQRSPCAACGLPGRPRGHQQESRRDMGLACVLPSAHL